MGGCLRLFEGGMAQGSASFSSVTGMRTPKSSPQELYFETFQYYHGKQEYLPALQWCYAAIAFSEQHEEGLNRQNLRCDLADLYLANGELDVGLALYTQIISGDPGDIWLYNSLGLVLSAAGLKPLAVEVLNIGLELAAKEDHYHLKEQLLRLQDEATALDQSPPDLLEQVHPEALASLRSALRLPAKIRKTEKNLTPYPPAVKHLSGIDERLQVAIYAETIAQGRALIPALIQLAYDPNDEAGAFHAIAILRTIRTAYPEELVMLASWLDQADGNWRDELLSDSIGKIGGYSTQALQRIAGNTGENNTMRAAAVVALRERAQRLPALYDTVVDFFRTLLTRSESYEASEEYLIAILVSEAADLEARQLYPEIKRVFEEDRLESGIIDLDFVHMQWGMPRIPPSPRQTNGMYLPLQCMQCNRIREHFTEFVLVDINSLRQDDRASAYDAHVLDHEVVCPKCEAVDRYRLTPMAHLRLAGPQNIQAISELLAGKQPKNRKPNPRVLYFRSVVFGKQMHPLAGLSEYRLRIASNPNDAQLYAKMGTLLRTIMRYPEALQALRQAYQLAPYDSEVLLRRALAEHDLGDKEVASQLYQKIINQDRGKKGMFQLPDEITIGALEGLNLLKQNKPSPWETKFMTSDGKQVDHPSMRPSIQNRPLATSLQEPASEEKRPIKRGRRGKRKK